MKASLLAPLFVALVFTGTAHSQNPDQPHRDGPPPGPMTDKLRHQIEELNRDGKHEEAERLQHHAREMWAQRQREFQTQHRDDSHRSGASGSPGERETHLAEAAKHLHAAGINIPPEMLERLAHRSSEKMGSRSEGSRADGPRFEGSRGEHSESAHPPFPPKSAPGAGAPLEAMHNEIRTLARQVQELRGMMQRQQGGEASRKEHDVKRPIEGEHRDRPAAPREHGDGQPRPQGEDRPRGESRPLNPPGNPPHGDRPHGDAPVPPPTR